MFGLGISSLNAEEQTPEFTTCYDAKSCYIGSNEYNKSIDSLFSNLGGLVLDSSKNSELIGLGYFKPNQNVFYDFENLDLNKNYLTILIKANGSYDVMRIKINGVEYYDNFEKTEIYDYFGVTSFKYNEDMFSFFLLPYFEPTEEVIVEEIGIGEFVFNDIYEFETLTVNQKFSFDSLQGSFATVGNVKKVITDAKFVVEGKNIYYDKLGLFEFKKAKEIRSMNSNKYYYYFNLEDNTDKNIAYIFKVLMQINYDQISLDTDNLKLFKEQYKKTEKTKEVIYDYKEALYEGNIFKGFNQYNSISEVPENDVEYGNYKYRVVIGGEGFNNVSQLFKDNIAINPFPIQNYNNEFNIGSLPKSGKLLEISYRSHTGFDADLEIPDYQFTEVEEREPDPEKPGYNESGKNSFFKILDKIIELIEDESKNIFEKVKELFNYIIDITPDNYKKLVYVAIGVFIIIALSLILRVFLMIKDFCVWIIEPFKNVKKRKKKGKKW